MLCGDNARAVQGTLVMYGYELDPVDGICGKKTMAGIKQFQESRGIKADGMIVRTGLIRIDQDFVCY